MSKMHPFFTLTGQFEPDEITGLLGIQPSWVKRIGDPGPIDALGPRLGAEWAWQPVDDDSDDVGDQLAFLAGALSLKRDQVAEVSKKFCGTFHVFDINRDWFVSAETLRLIADFQIDIQCRNIRFTQDDEVKNDAN
jgi:hypothetical protein